MTQPFNQPSPYAPGNEPRAPYAYGPPPPMQQAPHKIPLWKRPLLWIIVAVVTCYSAAAVYVLSSSSSVGTASPTPTTSAPVTSDPDSTDPEPTDPDSNANQTVDPETNVMTLSPGELYRSNSQEFPNVKVASTAEIGAFTTYSEEDFICFLVSVSIDYGSGASFEGRTMTIRHHGSRYSASEDGPQRMLSTQVSPSNAKNGQLYFHGPKVPGDYTIHYPAYHSQYGDIEVVWPIRID